MDNSSWTVPPGAAQPMGIQSTAGAVVITNEKGEVSMKKVKVQRYVSGKRPDYAKASSGEEESDDEDFTRPNRGPTQGSPPIHKDLTEAEMADPRLRRLMANKQEWADNENDEDADVPRRRVIHQAEVVDMSEGEEEPESPRASGMTAAPLEGGQRIRLGDSDSESEGEVDEDELALRRLKVRERAMQKTTEEEELLGKEDEGSEESSEEESSEYSEETDSEEEGPRLKPVFVRRKERVTILQKEQEETKRKQLDMENSRRTTERRHETLRMIENEHRQNNAPKAIDDGDPLNAVNTDDEADDAEYEAWKVRELRRLKRDKEEREAEEKAHDEIEKVRTMTEEERRIELRNNPKLITNKATKGKYKFLQKYYHRGAFFLDNEEDVFKRDFSGATLEDHFDKTILPKVMQVKNFGRSGRTKYTHLVDQDTTSFDSPWASDTQMNHKFFNGNAAGMKQVFERPSAATKKPQNNSSSTVRK